MEDVLGLEVTKKVEPYFLTNKFNKCCPFFISIGMTYEQFWYGDPTIANMYLEAFEIKEKREAEKVKWITWEQGLYVYEAICDVSPVLRAFSKATKPLPYPERPYATEEKEKQDKKIKELEQERDKYRTQIYFQNWAANMKKRFQEKKERKEE